MRTGFLSAAAVLAVVLTIPADSFARQNAAPSSAGMMRSHTPRAPINPPRFQGVKAGPLKGPASPPPGYRDRSIPTAARHVHRHSLRGHRLPQFGLGLGYVSTAVYALYAYDDPSTTYAQEPFVIPHRPVPTGQCWTEHVRVSPDRSRDVRITRC